MPSPRNPTPQSRKPRADKPDFICFSILRWPVDVERHEREIAIRAALGVDEFQARRIVICGVPTVARIMPPGPHVAEAIRLLAKLDAVSFAPTRAEIDAFPDPLRAKSLAPAVGAPRPMYAVEPWRGHAAPLVMNDVALLVRGVIKRSQTRIQSAQPADFSGAGLTGTIARAAQVAADPQAAATVSTGDSVQTRQIIDLYRADASRIRIDADKFSFSVLGESRGLSDAVNADILALRLAQEATRAIVDTGFSAFRPAVELALSTTRRAEGPDGTIIQTDRSNLFDFYTRWCFLAAKFLAKRRA